jgi:hypothetical protein
VDEDMSGIQTVLYCLAKYDEALRGELLLTNTSKSDGNGTLVYDLGISNDHIQYEILNSMDYERMKECFGNIRSKLVQKTNKKEIQKLCIQRSVTTSKEYDDLRKEVTHLPEDPKFNGVTWYDFLNPTEKKIELQDFANTVIQNNKKLPTDYVEWSSSVNLPSLQNIRDGYFGEKTNCLEIMEMYAPIERRRR